MIQNYLKSFIMKGIKGATIPNIRLPVQLDHPQTIYKYLLHLPLSHHYTQIHLSNCEYKLQKIIYNQIWTWQLQNLIYLKN